MIDPAKPPFPRLKYFPFQPETGIQTSTLISESFDGLISAVTRQKAGRRLNAPRVSSCWSNGPAGRVNPPEATVCADVIVVSSRLRLLNFSQTWAAACTALRPSKPATITANRIRTVKEIEENIFPLIYSALTLLTRQRRCQFED